MSGPSIASIDYLRNADSRLSLIIDAIGPLEYSLNDDYFRFMAHTVIEQMMSKSVATIIESRVVECCGGVLSPERVSNLEPSVLRATGMSMRKANTLINLACRYDEYRFQDYAVLPDEEVTKRILSIPGLGPWSAKMFLIFALGREDVLPYEDGAFLQAYMWLYNARSKKPSTIKRRCACWKPYQSIASRYLYRALDTGLTKTPLEDFLHSKV